MKRNQALKLALEAMQEQQVTVDGVTRPLSRPFLVLATQNPIEYEGTFPLPEGELDRFLLRLSRGEEIMSSVESFAREQQLPHGLVIGIGAEPVYRLADTAARELMAPQVYVEAVLGGGRP